MVDLVIAALQMPRAELVSAEVVGASAVLTGLLVDSQ